MSSLWVKFQPSSTPPSDRFWWGALVLVLVLLVLLVLLTGVKQSQILVFRLRLEFDNKSWISQTYFLDFFGKSHTILEGISKKSLTNLRLILGLSQVNLRQVRNILSLYQANHSHIKENLKANIKHILGKYHANMIHIFNPYFIPISAIYKVYLINTQPTEKSRTLL